MVLLIMPLIPASSILVDIKDILRMDSFYLDQLLRVLTKCSHDTLITKLPAVVAVSARENNGVQVGTTDIVLGIGSVIVASQHSKHVCLEEMRKTRIPFYIVARDAWIDACRTSSTLLYEYYAKLGKEQVCIKTPVATICAPQKTVKASDIAIEVDESVYLYAEGEKEVSGIISSREPIGAGINALIGNIVNTCRIYTYTLKRKNNIFSSTHIEDLLYVDNASIIYEVVIEDDETIKRYLILNPVECGDPNALSNDLLKFSIILYATCS